MTFCNIPPNIHIVPTFETTHEALYLPGGFLPLTATFDHDPSPILNINTSCEHFCPPFKAPLKTYIHPLNSTPFRPYKGTGGSAASIKFQSGLLSSWFSSVIFFKNSVFFDLEFPYKKLVGKVKVM